MPFLRRTPRRPLRRVPLVPVLVSCAALAAGCTASGTAPGGAPVSSGPAGGAVAGSPAVTRVPALHWHTCTVQGAPMRCANLRVPLDYAHPGGRQLSLALSMVPASAPAGQRQGDLLVNPGGPGGSGLGLASDIAQGLNPAVAADYNIIGFDPRGVGSSVPALHCDPSFFRGVRPNYIPANKAAEQVLIGRAKMYASDCEKRYGWLLPFMTTRNVARDMDVIRAALGQRQISFYGMSYGTYLGQVYATMFPGRIRRMVLDSTVDPRGVWYSDNISQDYAFQHRMEAFFSWVASHHAVYGLGATRARVQQAWYAARARLAAHPVSGPSGPLIGPDEFDDTFLVGGYSNTAWPALASALSGYLRSGATGELISLYRIQGRQSENEFAVYNAVECADVNWPRNWSRWDADTRKVYRTAPFQAWDNAWFNAACAFWPVHGPATPMQIKGAGLPGILMIQGTLDPATPYQGALVARRQLPSARMVAVVNSGNHVQSLFPPINQCVNGYVNRYLATGALPQHSGMVNATCPAPPPPAPGG